MPAVAGKPRRALTGGVPRRMSRGGPAAVECSGTAARSITGCIGHRPTTVSRSLSGYSSSPVRLWEPRAFVGSRCSPGSVCGKCPTRFNGVAHIVRKGGASQLIWRLTNRDPELDDPASAPRPLWQRKPSCPCSSYRRRRSGGPRRWWRRSSPWRSPGSAGPGRGLLRASFLSAPPYPFRASARPPDPCRRTAWCGIVPNWGASASGEPASGGTQGPPVRFYYLRP
jgi:hypothetical protein